MNDQKPVLAIDIGGTKFAAGLVDRTGGLTAAVRVPTPPGGNAEALWKTLSDLLDEVAGDNGPAGVGVGCGGPMAWPEGVVSPLNMPGWHGFPLRERLAERYPGVPVRIHNDAVCVAVAEHWQGAGRSGGDTRDDSIRGGNTGGGNTGGGNTGGDSRGADNMIGMVVSTGVGGGLILNGRLIDGGTGNAGHIGHIIVEPDGPECGCGGRGCLEAVARGPALAAWAVSQGWQPSATPYAGTTGTVGTAGMEGAAGAAGYEEAGQATGRRLAADAAAGDAVALAAMRRAGRALGLAIASATHLCDIDLVTIGGGLSQAGRLLFDPLEETLRAHARMGFARRVRVVPAALGQDAGLIGAAALLLVGHRYWSPTTN
ncbi:ROK family protein [Microtetraspora sp. NBRC 13810]|uniref:ROK family protein n=1 Tax=Microtetraspora sp. NBRC 13810 TaxID=3030990 RepID=UPI0025561790|nr:ROK family protein [Microtetraspora sp. NBRC 13810]